MTGATRMTIVYLNDGSGEFDNGKIVNDKMSWYLGVEDIDSDGDKDLIYGSGIKEALFVVLNDGGGNFGEEIKIGSDLGLINHLEIVDWDGDGDLDIFTSSNFFDEFLYFENLIDIPVSIIDHEEPETTIYPNPNSGTFSIGSENGKSTIFNMINMQGNEVYPISLLPANGKVVTSQIKGAFVVQFFDENYRLIGSKIVGIQ